MVMNINLGGSSVTIDGKTFKGNSVCISNGKVTIDGVDQDGELVGDINVTVNGDCESIENTNGTVTCESANRVKTTNGKVFIQGSVSGDVDTTNGDVNCGTVGGSVKTNNGDITHR
tara:strand:+ start:353 stop:700 length:348 start_codon:yes stop_codon:yes gene_type:complete